MNSFQKIYNIEKNQSSYSTESIYELIWHFKEYKKLSWVILFLQYWKAKTCQSDGRCLRRGHIYREKSRGLSHLQNLEIIEWKMEKFMYLLNDGKLSINRLSFQLFILVSNIENQSKQLPSVCFKFDDVVQIYLTR